MALGSPISNCYASLAARRLQGPPPAGRSVPSGEGWSPILFGLTVSHDRLRDITEQEWGHRRITKSLQKLTTCRSSIDTPNRIKTQCDCGEVPLMRHMRQSHPARWARRGKPTTVTLCAGA
jgi:hypothetical protein